ncbi:hypothetical protein VNI00_018144 [Paramarasmius palmivorus]|uniref:Uncharacterized protein n=1 Tax=Paramarasmius palmivorus TaxID=297713 RepID=A0AAW0B3U6_9AGAR
MHQREAKKAVEAEKTEKAAEKDKKKKKEILGLGEEEMDVNEEAGGATHQAARQQQDSPCWKRFAQD